ncbi:hypothetical protein WJX74_001031 [Apatococcus lobatus]|uniref:acetyl-CoA carboxytransferase n=2 Tax=Apatococcus TaxID=904362 RepID=A0AAW1T492_9CHLO
MLPATRSPCSFSRTGLDAPVFARPPVPTATEPRSSVSPSSSDRESVKNLRPGHRSQLLQACSGPVLRPLQRAAVHCSAQKRDPPDAPKEDTQRRGGREWLQTLLSRFGPLTDKAPNRLILDFEKPLVELDNRIKEVRRVAEENGVNVSEQIKELENRAMQLRRDTYTRLSPVQRLHVARHPNRPTFLDIALNISDKFVELHGDRGGLDDPAMVCGLASVDGISFMFIGHQKGRNTKENIHRNFGMPQPNGYRKALRFMRHADHFGFPIVTFVDTPGAFAGKAAEEQGQGEAIAVNLREMFGFRVPIISLVIGEGGSGGALAIGCANRSLIMEHSVYYVASPEACAAILWKSRDKANTATEALKITSNDLLKFGVMDEIVPEPLGGAHSDPMSSFTYIKHALLANYNRYASMSEKDIKADRYGKFRKLGQFEEHVVVGGAWRETREERAKAVGAHTTAGTWAADEDEAKIVEMIADRDESWTSSLSGKEQWLRAPASDHGMLRSGMLQLAEKLRAERQGKSSQKGRSPGVDGQASPESSSSSSPLEGIVGVKQQLEELESQASNNGAMPEHTRR